MTLADCNRVVIGLFPELLATGGIQRASRHVAAVLAAFALEHGKSHRFLSLNDPPGEHRACVAENEFSFSGFGRGKFRFIGEALRLARAKPQLIVSGHVNLVPVAWVAKRQSPGARILVLTHGIEVWAPLSPLRRWALQRADLALAPSADTAQHLVTHQGVRTEKIRQMPWALDPEFAAQLAAPQTNHLPTNFPKGRVVLTVGRWVSSERYKGADHLIAAIPLLLPAVPDIHLVIVGEGDDLDRLKHLAGQTDVPERVRFLSGLAQEELMACYAACDVFALPSRGEGFGLVFLEAMAHGKPVVGGAHGGTSDIIEDGATGFLVRRGDPGELSQVLERLLTDEPLRKKMGPQARERVLSTYRFEHFQARLGAVLADLCAS